MLFIKQNLKTIIFLNSTIVLSSIIAIRYFYKYYLNKKIKKLKQKKYPKYQVILHQYQRGLRAPSLSPYALKLETWLRMANIPYQVLYFF